MIQIAPFSPNQAPAVTELVLAIQQGEFAIPITLEMQPDLRDVAAFFQWGGGNFWVAQDAAEVVGTIALLDIGAGQGALRKMFVKASHRGASHGVGKALLETLLDWCRDRGIREVFLGSAPTLHAAHRFYEKNGFEPIRREELPTRFPVVEVDTRFYRRAIETGSAS